MKKCKFPGRKEYNNTEIGLIKLNLPKEKCEPPLSTRQSLPMPFPHSIVMSGALMKIGDVSRLPAVKVDCGHIIKGSGIFPSR